MKRTKKAIASLAIAGMALTGIPFNALAADTVSKRLGGYTAAQTAVQIAEQTGWSGAAVLASSTSYGMVDALTAGPLASYLKAPILLQEAGDVLNPDTKAELMKLNVKTVYVTSGTAVISQAVLDQLKAMNINVISLGGADRFETSVNIAKEMLAKGASVNKVAVAFGWLNQDALSIASIAAAQTEPILLTEKDNIPASVREFLNTNSGVTTTDVIGGTGVISDTVKAQLPNPTRHFGYSAYDTNLAVLKAFDSVLKYDRVFIANGETAIDALAGTPLAAQSNSGIVLTNGTANEGTRYVSSKLTAASVVTALGGTAVVPETVLTGVAYVPPVVPEEPVTPTNPGGGGGGGGGGNPGNVTTATVSNTAELNAAIANTSIKTIEFGANINQNLTITRPLVIDFNSYVLTGNVSFNYTSAGTSTLRGSAGNRIVGNLSVDTANASFVNGVSVSGSVNIINVEPGTWTEKANGNTLTITDDDGSTITIEGSPGSVVVSETASGTLAITIRPGATVHSIVCNAPVSISVAAGAVVADLVIGAHAGGSSVTNNGTTTNMTVEEGANGTTVTNNGTMAKLTSDATISLVANVAPTSTTTGTHGSVSTSGTAAGSVHVISLTSYINAVNSANVGTIIAALQALAAISPLEADKIIPANAAAYVEDFALHPTDTVSQIRARVDAVNAAALLQAPKITATTIDGAVLTNNTLTFSFADLKKDSEITVSKDAKMSLSFANSGTIGDFNLTAGSNSILTSPLPTNADLDLSQANMTAIFNAIKDLEGADKEAILNAVDFGRVLELIQETDEETQNQVFEQMGFEDFYAGIRNADRALKDDILDNMALVIDKSLEDSNASDFKTHVVAALLPLVYDEELDLSDEQIDTLLDFYRSDLDMTELLSSLHLSVAQKELLIDQVNYTALFEAVMEDLSPETRAEMFKAINFTNLFEAMKTADEAQKAQIYENIINTLDAVIDSNVSRADLLEALVFGADRKDAVFQILKNLDGVTSGNVTVTVTLTDNASRTSTYTFVIGE